VVNTFFQLGDYERALACNDKGAPYFDAISLAELGRQDEAIELLRSVGRKAPPRMREFMDAAIWALEGRGITAEALEGIERGFFAHVSDPEGLFYASRHLAKLGEVRLALREFTRAVDGGYFCYPAFRTDKWLDNLRGHEEFEATLARAKERYLDAARAFKAAHGEAIVGVKLALVE
jgi:tetratricopeptide (TPR) repeat protein